MSQKYAFLSVMKTKQDNKDESGMSLIELLVYIMLVAVIGALITGLLINVFRVNAEVNNTSEASNDAQLLMERVEIAVRNAAALHIEDSGDSTLLITQTRSTEQGGDNAAEYRCIGIYFDAGTSKIHYVTDDTNAPRSKAAAGNPSAAAAWPVFLEDVTNVNNQKVLQRTSTGIEAHYVVNPPRISNPVELQSFIDTRSLGENLGRCF